MASKKQHSSPKSFGAILAVIAIVGVSAIGWVMSRPAKIMRLDPSLVVVAFAGVVTGSPDALVEVVEFADFECPSCGNFAVLHEPDVMAKLVATGEIRFRFMDYPITEIHRNSVAAHNAAACANEQGKFWEMHDRIFQNQDRWNGLAAAAPKKVLKRLAGDAGLDVGKWDECYDSERMLPQIAANRREGERLRVRSTPTFIVGDQVITEGASYDVIKKAVTMAKILVLASRSEATGKAAEAPGNAAAPPAKTAAPTAKKP